MPEGRNGAGPERRKTQTTTAPFGSCALALSGPASVGRCAVRALRPSGRAPFCLRPSGRAPLGLYDVSRVRIPNYGAFVASQVTRVTTVSGFAAGEIAATPTSLPSLIRPTDRNVTCGAFFGDPGSL